MKKNAIPGPKVEHQAAFSGSDLVWGVVRTMRLAQNKKINEQQGKVGRVRVKMRIALNKRGTKGDTLTAVRNTLRGTPNSNDSEGAMTTMAKSIRGKRSVTQVANQTTDKNFGIRTSLGYPIDYMRVDRYCTVP